MTPLNFQRPNSWTRSGQKFSSLLFTVTSAALPWDLYFFKLTQPLTVFTVQLLYTEKEKGGKPDRKPYPLPYSLRHPYWNLKSENSQDYAQKPQRNYTFMNSASGNILKPNSCVLFLMTGRGGGEGLTAGFLLHLSDKFNLYLMAPSSCLSNLCRTGSYQ
jgi:hypothetical protein